MSMSGRSKISHTDLRLEVEGLCIGEFFYKKFISIAYIFPACWYKLPTLCINWWIHGPVMYCYCDQWACAIIWVELARTKPRTPSHIMYVRRVNKRSRPPHLHNGMWCIVNIGNGYELNNKKRLKLTEIYRQCTAWKRWSGEFKKCGHRLENILSEVYYYVNSCHGTGHVMDPTISLVQTSRSGCITFGLLYILQFIMISVWKRAFWWETDGRVTTDMWVNVMFSGTSPYGHLTSKVTLPLQSPH